MKQFNALTDNWYMLSKRPTTGKFTVVVNNGESFQVNIIHVKFYDDMVNALNNANYRFIGEYLGHQPMLHELRKLHGSERDISHPAPIVEWDNNFSEKRDYWMNCKYHGMVFNVYEMGQWLISYGYSVKGIYSASDIDIIELFGLVTQNNRMVV